MKISVIIPTYKPQNYLWECLDSLVTQTFPKEDFEVILVLNGCTEPYKSSIEKYIAEKMLGMNVNFIHTEVGGVSNARNLALDQLDGDFVTFIDDDDFVSESYLSELFNKATPNTVSVCYPLSFYDGKKQYMPYNITANFEKNLTKKDISVFDTRKFFSGPVYKLIHKNIISNERYDKRLKNGEDTLFMFAISKNIKEVSLTSKEAIYYRRFRKDSAATKKRTFSDRLKSNCIQISEYMKLYIKAPFKYNFIFFLTRLGGAFLGIFR